MSLSAAPCLSQSDTTTSTSSSLWNSNNKSTRTNFLSRFKSPNPVPTPSKSTSHYITTSLPPIHGQQQQRIKRKPIVSNVSSSGTNTTTSTTPVPRKKYETLLGIRTEDLISEGLNSKKKSSGHHGKGFGSIFKKKRSKSLDKKVNADHIDALFYQTQSSNKDPAAAAMTVDTGDQDYVLPPVEPFARSNHNQIIYTSPIKAPVINQSMGDKPVILANNHVYKPQYHQYEIGQQPSAYSRSKAAVQEDNHAPPPPSPPTNETPRWSTGSAARKSTGSYSIYSTFGPESIYDEENDSLDNVNTAASTLPDSRQLTLTTPDAIPTATEPTSVTDLVSIVASNMQSRHPARLVREESSIHETSDNEDDSSCSSEDGDDDDQSTNRQSDVFVDATDIMSLEDIEREKMEARLSKRLSGGHFGSAGGLMISILASTSTETKAQKRASRPPPEDVVQSMINWKRHSGHGTAKYNAPDLQLSQHEQPIQSIATTDLHDQTPPAVPEKNLPVTKSRSLSPQRPLPPNPNILLTTTKEADNEEDGDEPIEIIETTEESDSPKQCASRLWEEDESFVQRERIAEWLGQSKELNADTLSEYMNYFEFATMRLDSAFRKVCSKLYFRAEAQQIDRILEAFAKRYWECNPKTIFGSADIVYAVVYSLLLLNTDLHVAQGNYTRMTRQAFVKNTMSTIRDQQQTDPKWAAKKPNFMLAWEAHIEAYLKDMYISVKNYQILQPMQQSSLDDSSNSGGDDIAFLSVSTSSSKRMSIMGGKRMIDIKRSLNTMIHKNGSTRESMLFLDEPSPRKSSSSNTRQQYPASPHSSKSMHSTRRDSFSSSHSNSGTLSPKSIIASSNGSQLSPHPSHMMNFMDAHSADLFANRPPYLKEGVVMRKHLLESANQKAKHREWRECLLVVGQGELKMYGLQSENANDSNSISSSSKRNVLRASSASFANLADTLSKNYQNVTSIGSTSNPNVTLSYSGVSQDSAQRWGAYSQLMGSIELNHSLSNALPPPGYNKSRPHVFAIQEPNGGVYLFQAASNEQVMEWVSTCNYWAARQSKEPLQGGVGNLEYGWGSCLNDVILDLDAVESGEKITGKYFHDPDAVSISHWIPPAPTMVSSILDEKAQFESLQAYVNQLNEEINEHREIKRKILVKFQQKGQNHTRAFANWESKSKYMLHEIIKYQNYCDSLEKSIQSREAEQEGEE
ncbi:sec7 domain-containing protein [Mucor ambiguus]|uniref:Sec7 domain-containing protein n=1 Tax=Mucor ambiguus TaxID=91626 RepID=A0A0C9M9E2_9FUNG|nr:sec7 domain-containing protein [Mucor ambiguus]